jgi:hypothetical protein
MSSPAQTLGSLVHIPLETFMSVCIYSAFVLYCVGSGLAMGWSPSKESYRLSIRLRNCSGTAFHGCPKFQREQLGLNNKQFLFSHNGTWNMRAFFTMACCLSYSKDLLSIDRLTTIATLIRSMYRTDGGKGSHFKVQTRNLGRQIEKIY